MKCRRCKTVFDYDTYYGICPKCAAYNRPDGKDELKEVMGEDAKNFQEEYHPPVMSSGDFEAYSSHQEHVKTNKKKKSYHERLCNPYLEEMEKTGKKKTVVKTGKQKKKGGAKKGLIAVLVCLIGFAAELAETFGTEIQDWFAELETSISAISEEVIDFSEIQNAYYAFEVYGRGIQLARPYLLQSDAEEETLLVIPYHTQVYDKEMEEDYVRSCSLLYEGNYLSPLENAEAEELFGNCKGIGTLEESYEEGHKSLVFSGEFENLEDILLNLLYQSPEKDSLILFYYNEETYEWQMLTE